MQKRRDQVQPAPFATRINPRNATTVQRTNVTLHPDRTRVLLRPFLLPNEPRAWTIWVQGVALHRRG